MHVIKYCSISFVSLLVCINRFSKENREKHHPFAWMPFGAGPRNCIGMRFALMEAKIVMIRVLQKFYLETCPQTEVTFHPRKQMFLISEINIQQIRSTFFFAQQLLTISKLDKRGPNSLLQHVIIFFFEAIRIIIW